MLNISSGAGDRKGRVPGVPRATEVLATPGNSTVEPPPVTPPVANTSNQSTNGALPTFPSETIGSPSSVKVIDLGGGVKIELVLIHPGSFNMGSDKGDSYEKPVHMVTLTKEFYLGKYEVTQEQWEKIIDKNPSKYTGKKNPVETVSWYDCQNFLKELQEKVPGWTFRLPTEAEWEYACRAGTKGDYAGALDDMAWYSGNANETTHPVGQKKPNAWGLYDMHGNINEWCADWRGDYPTGSVTDPPGGTRDNWHRVFRGGSYDLKGEISRSASRLGDKPDLRLCTVGFRLVAVPAGR